MRKIFDKPAFRMGVLTFGALILLIGAAVLRTARLLFQTTGVYFWKVFYQRGTPCVIVVCLLTLFLMVAVLTASKERLCALLARNRKSLTIAAALCALCAAGGVWIARTGIGLTKENAFYGKPTVALMEWHLIAAGMVCAFWMALEVTHPEWAKIRKFFPLVIWLCAFLVWTAIPNQEGFFSPAGRAPNYEIYPFSDGSFYGHYARAAAAGMGFKGTEIPPRPLYIAVLSFLHLLGENHYETIILFQTLILALLPAVVYLVGELLHSSGAGLAAALLVILRETHAIIAAPFGHNVSTTKYFFSDLPAALACAFFVLMMLRWLKARREGKATAAHALWAGCALGVMTLIRTQSLCLIILLLFVLFDGVSPRQILAFFAALVCCFLPWLTRNYRITGRVVFDHPVTQTAEMARSYNFDGEDLSQQEGENDGDYNQRLSVSITRSFRNHPAEILRFITVHFVNNEVSNLRLLPLRNRLAEPSELLRSRMAFWEDLDTADLDSYNLVFLALGTLMIIFGISAAAKVSGGLLPICAITIFNLSTAVGRYSAGRYLIPCDWIIMLYFAVGLAALLKAGFALSGFSLPVLTSSEERPTILGAVIAILLTAALISASEHLIPVRFTPASETEVREKLGDFSLSCPAEQQIIINALTVYPRYYAAGEGEPESAKQGYAAVDYGRLVFLTLAPGHFGTYELRTESLPPYLPDGAEVWLAACQSGATSLVEKLRVDDTDGGVFIYESDRQN